MAFSKKNHSTHPLHPLHPLHSTELFKIFFSLLTLSTAFLQKACGPGKNRYETKNCTCEKERKKKVKHRKKVSNSLCGSITNTTEQTMIIIKPKRCGWHNTKKRNLHYSPCIPFNCQNKSPFLHSNAVVYCPEFMLSSVIFTKAW